MNSNPVFSIIIPAFNAEKTIKKTINSIVTNVNDYEIIVVENGSTDNTAVIVDKLIEKNQRIRMIRSKKGVSMARNTGIGAATGKWIIFVDADDLINDEFQSLDLFLKNVDNVDCIICNYYKNKGLIRYNCDFTGRILRKEMLFPLVEWMMSKPTERMTIWAKVFDRKFLIDNCLTFDTELRLSEDSVFMINCLEKCSSAFVLEIPYYIYCLTNDSTVRGNDPYRKKSYIKALEKAEIIVNDSDIFSNRSYLNYIVSHINLIAVHDVFCCENKQSWITRKKDIRELLSENNIKKAVKDIKLSDIKDIQKLPSYCFKKGFLSIGGFVCYLRSIQNKRGKNG